MAVLSNKPVSYHLEYQWNDKAWYTCGVLLEDAGNLIHLKFQDFIQSSYDEVFKLTDFKDHDEIEQFIRRFRPISEAVEDYECSKLIQGMTVCSIYDGDDGSRLYYDAIVDDVHSKEHTAEECLCTFFMLWQNGPAEGYITTTRLQDIYLIQTGSVDPVVFEFVKRVKEKLRGGSTQFSLIPKPPFLSKKTNSNETSYKSQEFGGVGCSSQVRFPKVLLGRERFCSEESDQDIDMGGVTETICRHHYLILENLEKDLCPLKMMDFIHEHTSVRAQTYIFPSLSSETYARGAIVVDKRSNLKRIYDFISNSNHFIVSFSERPWVIAEDKLMSGTFNTDLQCLQRKSEKISTESELMIVHLGTETYMKAKQQRDLYMEFRNHINRLENRLGMEVQKIRKNWPASVTS